MKSETAYLLAIVIIAVAGVGGIVAIDLIQPQSVNVALVEHVMTILTITLPILLGILKSLQNGQAIQQAAVKAEDARREAAAGRQELRQNTEATLAISEKLDTVVPPGSP